MNHDPDYCCPDVSSQRPLSNCQERLRATHRSPYRPWPPTSHPNHHLARRCIYPARRSIYTIAAARPDIPENKDTFEPASPMITFTDGPDTRRRFDRTPPDFYWLRGLRRWVSRLEFHFHHGLTRINNDPLMRFTRTNHFASSAPREKQIISVTTVVNAGKPPDESQTQALFAYQTNQILAKNDRNGNAPRRTYRSGEPVTR